MTSLSKFVRKEVRYRHGTVADPLTSASHIHSDTVAVGQTYHLESDAQFKRDLEQSLADIVTRRLQEAEDQAIALVKIAEETAEKNAKQIADDILAKANAQAKEMVETAQSQVDSIKEAAHEAGFKAGFQEGYSDATAQVEQETVELLQGVHSLTEKAYQTEKLVIKNFEKNAVEIITHVARKVLRRELNESPETLLSLVQQAVESLYISGKVKVVVNPQVLQDIRAYSTVTENALQQMNRFEFIVDPALELTQLFIIGEEGCFDLSPDNQVAQLIAPLHDTITLPQPEITEDKIPDETIHEAIEAGNPEASVAVTEPELIPDTVDTEPLSANTTEKYQTNAAVLPEEIPEVVTDQLEVSTVLDEEAELEPLPEVSEPTVKPYLFESFDDPADEETL